MHILCSASNTKYNPGPFPNLSFREVSLKGGAQVSHAGDISSTNPQRCQLCVLSVKSTDSLSSCTHAMIGLCCCTHGPEVDRLLLNQMFLGPFVFRITLTMPKNVPSPTVTYNA